MLVSNILLSFLRHLFKIVFERYLYSVLTALDTMAMVLLALRCIVTDHRHRHLQHFVRRPARGMY